MPKITFAKSPAASIKTAIIPVYKAGKLSPSAKKHKKLIEHAIKNHPNFKGKVGQTLTITMTEKSDFNHIVLLGLNDPETLNELDTQEAGGKLFIALKALGATSAALIIEDDKTIKTLTTEDLGANIAYGLKLRSYVYDKYKEKPKKPAPQLKTFSVINNKSTSTKKAYTQLENIAEGVFTARDLVNAPPNELYPESYAKFIQNELKPLGLSVEIIGKAQRKAAKKHPSHWLGKASHSTRAAYRLNLVRVWMR